MIAWFRSLDQLLRGERTRRDLLAQGRIDLPLSVFIPLAILLGAGYGFFMGWFGAGSGKPDAEMYIVAAMVKVPALFLLTLFVTFPSLYVFNALVGTRLSFAATLKLLIAAIVVNLAVGASFGPILAFFTLSTKSYPFMVVLNVALLGIAGAIGLGFLLVTLRKIGSGQQEGALDSEHGPEPGTLHAATATPAAGAAPRYVPPPARRSPADSIFQIWVIIYALVGAQMAWLLRPFIGHPASGFAWFRHREGNFFSSLLEHIQKLIGG
jgi:hypothetical protein